MGEYFLYRIGLWISTTFSQHVAYKVARFFAVIKYYFAKKDRENVIANLSVILDKNTNGVVTRAKEVYRQFGMYLVDFFRFELFDAEYIEKNVTMQGIEHIEKVKKLGKGGILLSAHLGNWELGGICLTLLGYPVCAVARSHTNKKVNAFFIDQRKNKGLEVVPLKNSLRAASKWLRENKLFAILGDRSFTKDEVEVDFFSNPALFPKGPSVLSLRTGAPIIPCFIIRDNLEKCTFVFEKPIFIDKNLSKKQAVKVLIQKYVTIFEKYITLYPEQWFVFNKFWSS